MYVCNNCLSAIESHEGPQMYKRLSSEDIPNYLIIEDEYEELIKCEWCEEHFPINEMLEI